MANPRTAGPTDLREAHRQILDRIAQAAARSGRRPEAVKLVAVTKNATPDQIRQVVELGQADLGESKVQQLTQRAAQLGEFLGRKKTLAGAAPRTDVPDQVRWHMIGHLQRNKVKPLLSLVRLVHSVDSLRLAEELHNLAAREDRVVDILIQVNASGEVGKFGVSAPAVSHLAESIDTMMHLRLRGLMTMAPLSDDPEDARPTFRRTAEIFEEMKAQDVGGADFNILSMGMSNDFEVAVEEGANLLRVGTALFGPAQEA